MKMIFDTPDRVFEADFCDLELNGVTRVRIFYYDKNHVEGGNTLEQYAYRLIVNDRIVWLSYDFIAGIPTKEIDKVWEKILKMRAFL